MSYRKGRWKRREGGEMGELRVLGPEGDIKTIWDVDKPDEVKAAREQFDKLTKKKYSAFKVDADGDKSTRMARFDPNAGKVILVAPIAGG